LNYDIRFTMLAIQYRKSNIEHRISKHLISNAHRHRRSFLGEAILFFRHHCWRLN
jgi:hypothetical protein